MRGGPRHFTHSKVMAWVAFDRGIRAIETVGLEGPVDEWRAARRAIHEDVCAHGFDRELGSFVQSYGSQELDASLLLLPTVGFLPPDDPRVLRHDRRDRTAPLRGRLPPALRPGHERRRRCRAARASSWPAASGWRMPTCSPGRMDDARRLFERLLALRNDVGLLSEEYDTGRRRLVGNFPQAFSHIALVNTAHNLARAEKPAEQRSA